MVFTIGQQTLITDNQIIWLTVSKVGNPPAWSPSTNYNLGDIVVPTNPQPSQTNLAFQVVGFLGKSGNSQPGFPSLAGAFVTDNELEWECVNPNGSPPQLPYNQYFLLQPNLTVVPAD